MWLCVKGQWVFFSEKINLRDEGVEVLGMEFILIRTWKKMLALQEFESRMLFAVPFFFFFFPSQPKRLFLIVMKNV